jgi:signal transduction histidine kinase
MAQQRHCWIYSPLLTACTKFENKVPPVGNAKRCLCIGPITGAAHGFHCTQHRRGERGVTGRRRALGASALSEQRLNDAQRIAQDATEKHKLYLRVRELAQRLEAVREDERRAVAQALHESIAQELFAVRLGLDHLRVHTGNLAGVAQTCGELIDIVDKCLCTTRQIANDLLPSTLAHLTLTEALEDYAQTFGKMSRLSIRVAQTKPLPALGEAVKLNFFRAAQEALTNAAQHAHASRVEIVVRTSPKSLVMNITDDGIGVDRAAPAKAESLGLLAIRERFAALGGKVTVRKNAGSGTTVSARLALALPGTAKTTRAARGR